MDYEDIPRETRQYIRKTTYLRMKKWERVIYHASVKDMVWKVDSIRNDMNSCLLTDESTDEFTDDEPNSSDEELVRSRVSRPTYTKYPKKSDPVPIGRKISFVGMRFHGNHVFSRTDVISLKKDNNNPMDPYAVKVMLGPKGHRSHVAYVDWMDARYLRTVESFEKKPLKFYRSYANSCRYYFG